MRLLLNTKYASIILYSGSFDFVFNRQYKDHNKKQNINHSFMIRKAILCCFIIHIRQ